jgi:hypothetical protein
MLALLILFSLLPLLIHLWRPLVLLMGLGILVLIFHGVFG